MKDDRFEVRCRRVEGAPLVSMRLWIRGGSRTERVPGLSWVTGHMLVEGTRRRDWSQIAENGDDLGLVLSSFGGLECHGLRIDCLTRDWIEALRWLFELAFESVFAEDRCRWICQLAQAELESLADQPEVRAGWAFAEQLYHPHPAARPIQGDADSLASLTSEQCVAFHEAGLASGAVLSVAGEIDEDEVGRAIEAALDGRRTAKGEESPVPEPRGSGRSRHRVETDSPEQAHLLMGHLTVPITHPDYRELEVLSVILGAGSGLTGRIPSRIREREGLAYSSWAAAVAAAGLDPGRLTVAVGTSPSTIGRAEQAVVEELERLVAEGVEESEVDDARSYLLGREAFRRETARQCAELEAQATFYRVPLDRSEWLAEKLEGLDAERINALARLHVRPNELLTTVAIPGSQT